MTRHTIDRFWMKGSRVGQNTLTIEHIREGVKQLQECNSQGPYKAIFPWALSHHCLDAFGGRIEPCKREGLEGYDEIVDHNEGDVIILVEKGHD